jgi:signal transducing adaptor molecule
MEECYSNLKAKSSSLFLIPIKCLADVDSVDYRFDAPTEPPPREVDDEVRRKEEEELQRALELSVQDKGGKPGWSQYTLAANEATGSKPGQSSSQTYRAPPPESGYVPTSAVPPQVHVQIAAPTAQHPPARDAVSPVNPTPSALVTRVRALHSFEPTEVGELAFERGDIIRVVDRGYKDWWRGQLRGRTGIFPVNYVVSKSVGCLDFVF